MSDLFGKPEFSPLKSGPFDPIVVENRKNMAQKARRRRNIIFLIVASLLVISIAIGTAFFLWAKEESYPGPSKNNDVVTRKEDSSKMIEWHGGPKAMDVPFAVECGYEDNHRVVVARTRVHGDLIPGKCVNGRGWFANRGNEYMSLPGKFEVLADPHGVTEWVAASTGWSAGLNPVIGGQTIAGQNIYIGRVPNKDTCGRIEPSDGILRVNWAGNVNIHREYEVLCYKK